MCGEVNYESQPECIESTSHPFRTRKMAASLPGLRARAVERGLKIHHLGAGYPHPEVTDPRRLYKKQRAGFSIRLPKGLMILTTLRTFYARPMRIRILLALLGRENRSPPFMGMFGGIKSIQIDFYRRWGDRRYCSPVLDV
ncbi:MAG: hypothetical protein CM1200mP24_05380 [Gammaproteobacteria bacterium]|nr:MAG: hypothetical protein CM1200mP24_05380 [Gammaproteobacteria bacterium]